MARWNMSTGFMVAFSKSVKSQVDLLPTEYLRQFFRIKIEDDIRAINSVSNHDSRRLTGVRRLEKVMRSMEAANAGRVKDVDSILDMAYGRKGRLRWELMEPFTSKTSQPIPERIIPAVEKSRPPAYSSQLLALLTSSSSRASRSRPITLQQVKTPPKLPARADPNSEDARLYGPLSKRRQVNIRWRFFAINHKKVRPPLQIVYEETSGSGGRRQTTDKNTLSHAGVRCTDAQDTGIFDEVEALARPPSTSLPPTRRERRTSSLTSRRVSEPSPVVTSHLPRKFLRRAYQRLLSRLPILRYTVKASKAAGATLAGRYAVSLSPHALSNACPKRVVEVDTRDLAWIELASNRKQPRQSHTNPS